MTHSRPNNNPNSPLPVNSELEANQSHQTFPEFTGRGVGGEGPTVHRSTCELNGASHRQQLPTLSIRNRRPSPHRSQSGFPTPLTPSPSPRKFGKSLIKWRSTNLRIFGERGALAFGFLLRWRTTQ